MKIFKRLLMLSLIVLSAMACGEDVEPDLNMGGSQATIFGNWSFVSSTTNGIDDTIDECTAQLVIKFVEAGMGFTRFERSGADCEVGLQITGNFSLSGNNLTITTGQETTTYEIIKLEKKTLTLRSVMGNDTIIENFE